MNPALTEQVGYPVKQLFFIDGGGAWALVPEQALGAIHGANAHGGWLPISGTRSPKAARGKAKMVQPCKMDTTQ